MKAGTERKLCSGTLGRRLKRQIPAGRLVPAAGQVQKELLFLNSTRRADTRAGAAGNAGIGIDLVLAVTLGNRIDRALARAGAARDTRVCNFISHNTHPVLRANLYFGALGASGAGHHRKPTTAVPLLPLL